MIARLEKIFYGNRGGFMASYIDNTNGLWHFHPEYELTLCTNSNGTRIIGDSVELFENYEMVLIGSNIPHSWNYYCRDGNLPEKHGIVFHFALSSIGDDMLSQFELQGFRDLLSKADRGVVFSKETAKKAEKFLLLLINDKGIDKIINFFNLIKVLISSDRKEYVCSENYNFTYDERGNKRMADVYTYISENYFKPISLEKIAGIAKMNPISFSRYFKENSGTCFVEYLNRVRTNKACYLLKETEYLVNEIALECGFSSISNFNKQFRKAEGVSPKHYREKCK